MKHGNSLPSGLTSSVLMLLPAFGICFAPSLFAQSAIPELDGVWQWGRCTDGSGFSCMLLEEDSPLLTNRARAYRNAIDEVAQPKYDCAPMSIPHLWTDPYSHQIEQYEDRVLFTYGKDDVVRIVWLEGHDHTPPYVNEFFYHGYSSGYYEDGALIVETSRFSFDPQGLNADFRLASSTQKKITERYSLQDDNLLLQVTTEDTFFLQEPWSFEILAAPDPDPLALPWNCDLDGARQTLKLLPSIYPEDPPVERIDYPTREM